jgi:hypothetical protein
LWETTPNEQVQHRIESLIHRLQLQDLQNDLVAWKTAAQPELLAGALLCTRFQYPDLTIAPVLSEMEKLRRNVWLELNNYLTPLEQINVLTSILFSYYGLKGKAKDYTRPEELLKKEMDLATGSYTCCCARDWTYPSNPFEYPDNLYWLILNRYYSRRDNGFNQ